MITIPIDEVKQCIEGEMLAQYNAVPDQKGSDWFTSPLGAWLRCFINLTTGNAYTVFIREREDFYEFVVNIAVYGGECHKFRPDVIPPSLNDMMRQDHAPSFQPLPR